ncbi:MAG TPA: hypothetical protein VFT99_26045, partial [Roseiflexaceae bacterium]|nr:hypothetical protein [Roseiflexaceae bacterium]
MQNRRVLVEGQKQAAGCLCALANGVRAILDRLCPPAPGTPGTPGNQRQVISFLSGTINILAEHAPEMSAAQIARAVAADLNSRGLSQQLVVPERGERSVVTFPAPASGRALSLIRTLVPGARPGPSRLIPALVNELNRQLKPVPPTRTTGTEPGPLLESTPPQAARAAAADTQAATV